MATAVQVPAANRFPTSFTTTHDTDGLPGWGALDWFRPAGTIVGSPVGGTIERTSGGSGSRGDGTVYGRSAYLRTDSGQRLFLTHFSDLFVRAKDRVEPGEPLGRVAPYGNASHIHVAVQGAADRGGKVNLSAGSSGDDSGVFNPFPGKKPPSPGIFDIPGTDPGAAIGAARSVGDLIGWITDPTNLGRVAQVGGGFVLLLVGLLLLGRRLGAELPGPAGLR